MLLIERLLNLVTVRGKKSAYSPIFSYKISDGLYEVKYSCGILGDIREDFISSLEFKRFKFESLEEGQINYLDGKQPFRTFYVRLRLLK